MGRLDEALADYETARLEFPNDPVPYGGHADVLKLLGRLDEALSEYEVAATTFPYESIPICGKADVLRTMGRYADAVEVYQQAVKKFPFQPVAYTGQADTIRDSGDVAEAIRLYEVAVSHFPQNVRIRSGRARALQAARRFEDALQAFDRNVRDFPYDLYSLVGRANLLRLLGYDDEALKAYDAIIERRPDYVAARNGKAAVLILLKRFVDADLLLPRENPKTSSEWVGFHIRGMMYLKAAKIDEALEVFLHGIQKNPFHRERVLFETGLAMAKLRKKEFSEAVHLVQSLDGPIHHLIKLHSFAELGAVEKALNAMEAVNDNEPPNLVYLRDAIATKFGLKHSKMSRDDNWIFDQEAEAVLRAA
jgi:tetratricopeptide (TPR) repeat protein